MSFKKGFLSSSGSETIFGGSFSKGDPSGPEVAGVIRDAKEEAGPGIEPCLAPLIGLFFPSSESSAPRSMKSVGNYIPMVQNEAVSSLRLDSLPSFVKSSSPNSIAKPDCPSSDPISDRESSS